MLKIKLRGDKTLVKEIKEEVKDTGAIIIAGQYNDVANVFGEVILTNDKELSIGDIICFPKSLSNTLEIENDTYILVNNNEIIYIKNV